MTRKDRILDFDNSFLTLIGRKFWEIQIYRYYRISKKNMGLSRKEILEIQNRKFISIVNHAYNTVPFYKILFDKNKINIKNIKSKKDIIKLPVISKKDIIKLPVISKKDILNDKTFGFISKNFNKDNLMSFKTGGSTGIPLDIFVSKEGVKKRIAENYKILFYHGFSIFDKNAQLMYYDSPKDWFNKLGLFRKKRISSDNSIEEQYKILKKYNPDIIEGYPSRLNLLSEYMASSNKKLNGLKMIFTNSETLYDSFRKKIETVFGNKIINVYYSWEFGRVAWECEKRNGLHINEDSFIVEILNNDKPAKEGEVGDIVVTDLNNYAMPFIRYKIGDISKIKKEKCDCGLPFLKLDKLFGRNDDYILLTNGEKLSSIPLIAFFLKYNGIIEFKIFQLNRKQLKVQILKNNDFKGVSKEDLFQINKITKIKNIDVEYVKKIKKTKNGKLKSFERLF